MNPEAQSSPGLHGDDPVAVSLQGAADRRELAVIAVERTRMPMVVSDARQPGNPLVLANQAFLNLTGYEAHEVIGRNCRFLQGEGTSPEAIAELRAAIAEEREVSVEILNYRKNGSHFWNQLHLSPIRDDEGQLLYFFASQIDVSEKRRLEALEQTERRLLREVDHRALNALAIVDGIVRLSNADNAQAYAAAVQRRVQAIARAHTVLAERGWTDVPLAQLLRIQVEPYGARAFDLNGPEVQLPGPLVQPLSLVFHELAANAATHGALSRADGRLTVHWLEGPEEQTVTLVWEERGGPPPGEDRASGFGLTMIHAIVKRQLQGAVQHEWAPGGLRAQLTIPTRALH